MREIIFDRALELFSERGFEGASMRELARRAGTTPSNVYNYFPSKDELLREVFHQGAAQIRESLDLRKTDGDLRTYLAGVIRTVDENPLLWRLIHQLRMNEHVNRILERDFQSILEDSLGDLETYCKEPWLLLAIVDGLVAGRLQRVPQPTNYDIAETVATCLEALDDA